MTCVSSHLFQGSQRGQSKTGGLRAGVTRIADAAGDHAGPEEHAFNGIVEAAAPGEQIQVSAECVLVPWTSRRLKPS